MMTSPTLSNRSRFAHTCVAIVTGVATTLVLMLSLTMLSGCNTTEGAGKDIKSLGKGIEETAQDAKD